MSFSAVEKLPTEILTALPQPGVYPNVLASIYHAWDACSNSRLKLLSRSPAHLRCAIDNPSDPTPALVLGDAAHLIILQPDLFHTRYVVAGQCSATKKDGGRCSNGAKVCVGGAWLCGVHVKGDRHNAVFLAVDERLKGEGANCHAVSDSGSRYYTRTDGRKVRVADHAPNVATFNWMVRERVESIRVDLPPYGNDDSRTVLTKDQWDACERMADSVMSNKAAAMLLNNRTATEVSAVWTDEETGVRMKARCDLQCDRVGLIGDLKTTQDASPARFPRALFELGYYRQAPLYLDGFASLGKGFDAFAFIAVEPTEPHASKVYQVRPRALDLGRADYRRLLETYATCLMDNKWPAYGDDVSWIDLPEYGARQVITAGAEL